LHLKTSVKAEKEATILASKLHFGLQYTINKIQVLKVTRYVKVIMYFFLIKNTASLPLNQATNHISVHTENITFDVSTKKVHFS
jgi:hypothetical protein